VGWRVRWVGYIRWPWEVPAFMADAANGAAELLGLPHRLSAADINYTADQIGADYGRLTAAGREALRLMATTEALLLDPVYTARAAAELIADVRSGGCRRGGSAGFTPPRGPPPRVAATHTVFGGCVWRAAPPD